MASDPLTILDKTDGLRRPLIIMAFAGWNDAAESATAAARYLGQMWPSRPLATIDPEEFYHFGLSRPQVRFKTGSRTEREITWPATEFSLSQPPAIDRDIIVGVAIEPHLRWRTYCDAVLRLARACSTSLVLTLGALLAEVPHTRPVRLNGSAADPELSARLGLRATRYEGPTGIVGVLNTTCRDQNMSVAALWANVPHYISGIENPKASMALVRRVLALINAEADLTDLEDSTRQFEQNLEEIVSQNAKIAEYVKKLERKKPDEDDVVEPKDELPPSGDLVAEIEQFLRQQRPDAS
jgi:proteasome assembly chaperone (PAC2) family protein